MPMLAVIIVRRGNVDKIAKNLHDTLWMHTINRILEDF